MSHQDLKAFIEAVEDLIENATNASYFVPHILLTTAIKNAQEELDKVRKLQ